MSKDSKTPERNLKKYLYICSFAFMMNYSAYGGKSCDFLSNFSVCSESAIYVVACQSNIIHVLTIDLLIFYVSIFDIS